MDECSELFRVSSENWGDGPTAVVGGIAWALGERDALHLKLDYLLHEFGLLEVVPGGLPIHYGIGAPANCGEGKGKHSDNNEVGVRIPPVIDYLFAQPLLDILLRLHATQCLT